MFSGIQTLNLRNSEARVKNPSLTENVVSTLTI